MLAFLAAASAVQAADFTDFLVLDRASQGGRTIIQRDALLARLASGWSRMPREGETVAWDGGQVAWRRASAGEGGWLRDRAMGGGWAAAEVEWDGREPFVLKCAGASQIWVNGLPYAGDVYSTETLVLPIQVKRGRNVFLFKGGRGQIRAERVRGGAVGLNFGLEATLPDSLGQPEERLLASAAIYNTASEARSTVLDFWHEGRGRKLIAPYGVARLPFVMSTASRSVMAESQTREFKVESKAPNAVHKRTFISEIDGSVQYYGVNPATDPKPGLSMILSPHGASVEAIGQAAAYGQKDWATLIAPTNRRPYGFDWEDWGRIDALEVLADAKKIYQPDEAQMYITGHSMGGHGTWILGNQFADQFAAIGPAAGWINFWSYGGAIRIENPDPVEAMFVRAAQVSDPLLTINNYKRLGVYTLHGDADATVPVSQARAMQERLKGIVTSLSGHEEPGQGHWYDTDPAPGANCVDHKPMFDFFRRHRRLRDDQVVRLDFATASPGVASKSNWAEIVMQDVIGDPSRIQIDVDRRNRRLHGTTENVRVLRITAPAHLGDVLRAELDGHTIEAPVPLDRVVTLVRTDAGWQSSAWSHAKKNPDRYGWFKSAFNHRFILVYGTAGREEETKANLGRANFDAQTWFYRANGDCDVVSDEDFKKMDHRGRSVILYGSRSSVSVWDDLVKSSEISVERGRVQLGGKTWTGSDLGVLFCLPKPREAKAMVGVVGYTGASGMVLTASWPYFLAGVHIPDVMVARSSMLSDGSKSILAAGFWDEDWRLAKAQMAFR